MTERERTLAMIADCMRYQTAPPDYTVQTAGPGHGVADTPALARVQGEGVVEDYREWRDGSAIVNDAGDVVRAADGAEAWA